MITVVMLGVLDRALGGFLTVFVVIAGVLAVLGSGAWRRPRGRRGRGC